MGFQSALSGLNASSKYLDVVGNNVANANTVGFKGSRAEFSDVYATSLASSSVQVGIGTRLTTVAQQFTQGNISTTSNPLDIAIQGNGFYEMQSSSGAISFARNGQFQLDRNGYIVNSGDKLLGQLATGRTGTINGGPPQPLQIQTAHIGALATGASGLANAGLNMAVNLDARKPIISRGTSTVSLNSLQLDNTGGASPVSYQTRVVDSTGQFHTLKVSLRSQTNDPVPLPNTWEVTTQLDSQPAKISSTPVVFDPATGQMLSGGTQALSFNPVNADPSLSKAYGLTPFNFTLSLSGATETASPSNGTIAVNDTAVNNTSFGLSGANLDSTAPAATTRTFSSNFTDPNGLSHPLVITLTKTGAANTWTPSYSIDGTAVTTLPDGVTPIPNVVFNAAGQITSGSLFNGSLAYAAGPNGEAAGTMNFKINLQGLTQTATAFKGGNVVVRNSPPVDPSDTTTYTHSTSSTVYDSQGIAHTLTMYMTKVGVNAWELQTSFDGATPVVQPNYLTFDAAGKLAGGTPIAYTSPIASPSGAQTPLSFNLNLDGSTQFGNQFGVSALSQDGYADGNLTGLSISNAGIIAANYSNGQNRTIGQITLANFANPQGLKPQGNNRWAQSYESGDKREGAPGTEDFGQLQSGAVEDSNVDLTKELVDMITAQRSYQANAQTIKTQDQVLQTLVNLR